MPEEFDLILWNALATDPWITQLIAASQEDRSAYLQMLTLGLPYAYSRAHQSNILGEMLLRRLCEDVNIWTRACLEHTLTEQLDRWALRELEGIWLGWYQQDWPAMSANWHVPDLTHIDLPTAHPMQNQPFEQSITHMLQAEDAAQLLAHMKTHIERFGVGENSDCVAFEWRENALQGLPQVDEIDFSQLQHIEFQRDILLENTRNFLAGRHANNVLLCGHMGSGKSSSVKALLAHFAAGGLRVVELAHSGFASLPVLMQELNVRGGYYIIFIDDLSFDANDPSYTQLKIALDGHLARPSQRILFHATSNRRNIVRDNWGDRRESDDVHANDTLNEKHSLAERFGIKLYFGSYSQQEYLDMIAQALEAMDIPFDKSVQAEAILWERTYHARSGRTAANFVKHYLAKQS